MPVATAEGEAPLRTATQELWGLAQALWHNNLSRTAGADTNTQLLQDGQQQQQGPAVIPPGANALSGGISVLLVILILIGGVMILRWFLPVLFWGGVASAIVLGVLMVYHKERANNRNAQYERNAPDWV